MSEVTVPSRPGAIDRLERRMLELGGEKRPMGGDVSLCPLIHRFTPGMYVREIFMPAGAVVTSAIHKTEHPFVISKGRCLVLIEGGDWHELEAPHCGITLPGTRRVLAILEDTVWTTFHATDLKDVEEIERAILVPYENPLLEARKQEAIA